jgi:hypothetical protein
MNNFINNMNETKAKWFQYPIIRRNPVPLGVDFAVPPNKVVIIGLLPFAALLKPLVQVTAVIGHIVDQHLHT